MTEIQLVLTNPTGLHARPASQFVQTASKFKSKVKISAGGKQVDAKSILGVMTMGLRSGTAFTVTADGEDEVECVAALASLVESKFGEE
ncbi:HPr family phosphocarrier protein [Heliobacillus mobilis]|uniref:Phosphocarrier protein HPr n=1 Tax=Heliobacterium mobile TaxID=28064 RepID=A0A6I3SLZ4_HELMO|nr:HPr family phosphocarrier protein [Heliobacterium mobile]MTV49983.1 HPr family phosphocarrier protein [Heliobacterium mobile]